MSYLAGEKQKLMELVDGLQAELAKAESAEEIPGLFEAWKRDCWRLFEEGMKQSFLNGKTAGRNGGAEHAEQPRRFAWRKPASGGV